MRADLHVHSTASDGTLAPAELVALAAGLNVSYLAITDHDTTSGVPEAVAAARDHDLVLIPGIELSATAADGRDVHILGYFIDHTDPALDAHLHALRSARVERAERMVSALERAGVPVDFDAVQALAGGGVIGRSHIARALVASGHATSVRDAFERLIGRGRPFYVPKTARPPEEVVAVIRRAGGIAVIAHPGVSGIDDLIPHLIEAGAAGVEAYHADHTPAQRERYAELAARCGLLVTGGTDYHGPDTPHPALGTVELPAGAIEALFAARDAATPSG